jgi:hypothetical protein
MSAPLNMVGGNFTLTTALISSGVQVECPFGIPDYIELKSLGKASDYTDGWGESSDAQAIEWFWEKTMPQNYAKGILQASEGSTPQVPAMSAYNISSLGIAAYNTANPPTYAGLATTAITGSTGAYVCTMADTGSIQVGDYVRLYGTTGELQLAGYTFQVTAVSEDASITLGYMATGGLSLAADATAGTVVKYIPNRMYPRLRYIANITQAAQAVVYFTEKHDFTIGENVSFRVPSSQFDMIEINNVVARVISVTNSSTESSITLDLDTTGYTAFDFPTSAEAAAGVSPAICLPSSSGVVPVSGTVTPAVPEGYNLNDAFDNRNVNLVNFGSGLFNVSGHASENLDVWQYIFYKYADYRTRILN